MIKKAPGLFFTLLAIFSFGGSLSLYGLMNWGMWNVLQMKNETIASLEKMRDPERKQAASEWKSTTKIPIVGKAFQNETVLLDGYSYTRCTFKNVTFRYEGTAPFDLIENIIDGDYVVHTTHPITDIIILLKELNYLRPGVPIMERIETGGYPNR